MKDITKHLNKLIFNRRQTINGTYTARKENHYYLGPSCGHTLLPDG